MLTAVLVVVSWVGMLAFGLAALRRASRERPPAPAPSRKPLPSPAPLVAPKTVSHASGRVVFVDCEADSISVDFMPGALPAADPDLLYEPVALALVRPQNHLLAAAAEGVLQRWATEEQFIEVAFQLTERGLRCQLRDGESRLLLDSVSGTRSGR